MMKRLRLIGPILVAIIAGVLLISCSASSPSPGVSSTPTSSTQPYGRLRAAVDFHNGAIFASATQTFNTGNTFQALGALVFDSLLEPTPEGKARPGIAERWEISPDGMSHTFYIRKGVKFQDGSDLTGADVKFSLELLLAAGATSSEAGVWRPLVAGVELKDDYTVVIRMKNPVFELLNGFENFTGAAAVVPKKYIEQKGWDYFVRNPVGSGPFRVVSSQPNTRYEYEAVESHWRAVPKFKNIEIIYSREEASKVAMLKTGELDIATISPDSVTGLRAAGVRVLGHYGAGQFYAIPFYDLDSPRDYAFGDLRVRKALSLAINRQELADKVYSGYAQPSFHMFVPRTGFFYDPNVLKVDPYDPEGAKRLLAEAGYPNGFATKHWDAGAGSDLTMMNQALDGYWRKIGISVETAPIDRTVVQGYYRPKHKPEVFNTIWSYSSGGGLFNFERFFTPCHSTKGTFSYIRNSKLDELIDKVPLTRDAAEKKRLAQEAALVCKNEYVNIGVLDVDTLFGVGSSIGQLTPTKGMLGLGFSYETVTHAK